MSRPIPGDQLISWLETWQAPAAIAADDVSYAK
jgi:hypothetical protein